MTASSRTWRQQSSNTQLGNSRAAIRNATRTRRLLTHPVLHISWAVMYTLRRLDPETPYMRFERNRPLLAGLANKHSHAQGSCFDNSAKGAAAAADGAAGFLLLLCLTSPPTSVLRAPAWPCCFITRKRASMSATAILLLLAPRLCTKFTTLQGVSPDGWLLALACCRVGDSPSVVQPFIRNPNAVSGC